MSAACERYRDRIPAGLTGNLDPLEMEELNRHLADCTLCADEQSLYADTLGKMRAATDVEVPHHFFQYRAERESPWRLFRHMQPAWQGALGAALLALIALSAGAIARLQIRAEEGGWLVSFGAPRTVASPKPPVKPDTSTLTEEILRIVERKNREQALELVRTLRAEMAESNRKLTDRQRALLAEALARVEQKVDSRIADVYQTVSQERERDNLALRGRIDRLAVNGEIKSDQTDAILETLLQVAELNVR